MNSPCALKWRAVPVSDGPCSCACLIACIGWRLGFVVLDLSCGDSPSVGLAGLYRFAGQRAGKDARFLRWPKKN